MKVAHLAEHSPHRCGLYETTKDMIVAERLVGIDAALVDSKVKDNKVICRPNLEDGDLPIRDLAWAKQADILVHHSIVHKELKNLGIPIVLAMHGRPESTFLLEHRRVAMIFGVQLQHGLDPRYKAFITFWKQYMFHLAMMVPKEKLFYVPAPVNLTDYKPIGKPHQFPGDPKLLIVDMWRHDVTPFNTIMAAARFKEKYCPTAKLSLIGTAPKKSSIKTLEKMLKKADVLGEMHPLIVNTDKCYRGADIVISPHNIATRVVRESLACGTPIVAGIGNPYTPFTADSRDVDLFAAEIDRCWRHIQENGKDVVRAEARLMAEKSFHPKITGEAVKKIYEKILEDEKAKWRPQDGLQRRIYSSYGDYLVKQKSKLDDGIKFDLKKYDVDYRKSLRARLGELPGIEGKNALCLGARQGTEVKAFLDVGCFAIGVDLNTGKDNKYVVTGDFHALQYHNDSVDIVFTNSLDHVYRIRQFLYEVTRVLKPEGRFIVELEGPRDKDADKWGCLHWDNSELLVNLFKEFDLSITKQSDFESLWFRRQIVFQKAKVLTRTDIINRLIEKNGYKRYLEIGVADPKKNFDKIVCAEKYGVDPNVECSHRMTSDEFFLKTRYESDYDIIFVDGLHSSVQAAKDIGESLGRIPESGTVVVHDCNPPTKEHEALNLCGTVWKAWAKLRGYSNYEMYVIDADYGVGVIKYGIQFPYVTNGEKLNYEFLDKNRKELLNLKSGDCL